jgi:PST family polysaccharide transporter
MGWLHVTAGRSDRWMRWGLFATAFQVAGVLCGLPFGPFGIATAYVVTMFILFVPALAYAGRPLEIHARDVVGIIWRPLLASLAAAAVAFSLRWTVLPEMHPVWRAAILGTAYLAAYLVLVLGVLNVRAPVLATQTLVRGYFRTRAAQAP